MAQELRVAQVDPAAQAVAADPSHAALLDLAARADLVAQVAAVVVPEAAPVGLPSLCSTPVRARLW